MTAQHHDFSAGLGVPQPHRVIRRPAHDARAIGRETGRPESALVAAQDQDLGAARRVPHSHRVCRKTRSRCARHRARNRPPGQPLRGRAAPGPRRRSPRPTPAPWCPQDPLTMRAPSGEKPAAKTVSRVAQDQDLGAARRVPHSHRGVLRPAHDARAIGRETRRPDSPFVAAQDQDLGAARRVPHPHRAVKRPAHDARAIGRETGRKTGRSWPRSTRTSAPLAASHTRTVVSKDPLTMRRHPARNPPP